MRSTPAWARIGASTGRSSTSTRESFLKSTLTISATVTVASYCLWAFERTGLLAHAGNKVVWIELTVIPLVLAVLHIFRLLDAGKGGEPEQLALHDHVLQGYGLLWLASDGHRALHVTVAVEVTLLEPLSWLGTNHAHHGHGQPARSTSRRLSWRPRTARRASSPRGLGRSYGDAAQCSGGLTIETAASPTSASSTSRPGPSRSAEASASTS